MVDLSPVETVVARVPSMKPEQAKTIAHKILDSGAKNVLELNWDTDGPSLFLVDRLLRPGGWIVFDDIEWS